MGTTSQVLTKTSATDYATAWQTPAAGGGLTQAEADLRYVNTAGDAMSGDLATPTLTVVATSTVSARVYGASTPTFAPSSLSVSGTDLGVRFRATPVAGAPALIQVRWYRVTAGAFTPASVRLWDTTTSGVVATVPAGDLTPFVDTAVGWKVATLTTPFTLASGREYVLAFGQVSGTYGRHTSYTPVPDAPVAFVANVSGPTGAAMPATGSPNAYGLDPVVQAVAATQPPAAAGAVRLRNAADITWRNAANTADLALTVDATQRPDLQRAGRGHPGRPGRPDHPGGDAGESGRHVADADGRSLARRRGLGRPGWDGFHLPAAPP